MRENKLNTISNLFEGKEIRSVWDSEKEEYYFSVVNVINALICSSIPRNYWSDLKRKLQTEGSQLHEEIVQLKTKSFEDGKMRETDTLDTKRMFRLIDNDKGSQLYENIVRLKLLASDGKYHETGIYFFISHYLLRYFS